MSLRIRSAHLLLLSPTPRFLPRACLHSTTTRCGLRHAPPLWRSRTAHGRVAPRCIALATLPSSPPPPRTHAASSSTTIALTACTTSATAHPCARSHYPTPSPITPHPTAPPLATTTHRHRALLLPCFLVQLTPYATPAPHATPPTHPLTPRSSPPSRYSSSSLHSHPPPATLPSTPSPLPHPTSLLPSSAPSFSGPEPLRLHPFFPPRLTDDPMGEAFHSPHPCALVSLDQPLYSNEINIQIKTPRVNNRQNYNHQFLSITLACRRYILHGG